MSVLKNQINLHPFTAPTAENITPAAESEPRTPTPESTEAGGKEMASLDKAFTHLEEAFLRGFDFLISRIDGLSKQNAALRQGINELRQEVEVLKRSMDETESEAD